MPGSMCRQHRPLCHRGASIVQQVIAAKHLSIYPLVRFVGIPRDNYFLVGVVAVCPHQEIFSTPVIDVAVKCRLCAVACANHVATAELLQSHSVYLLK